MSSTFGNRFKISIYGESHGSGIGVVIDSPPAGIDIDLEEIKAFMKRRAPNKESYSTKRSETDEFTILSGLFNGKTTGTPLSMVIMNKDPKSSDYQKLMDHPRPSHADFSGGERYQGFNDPRGGGHFSGRLTAPLCLAGAVAIQVLKTKGVYVGSHIKAIADICDDSFDSVNITQQELLAPTEKPFPTINQQQGEKMLEKIKETATAGDSIGGIIECCIIGLKAGHGDPMFWGIENRVSSAVFGVPAVKGIEFGSGFEAAKMLGSQHNDVIAKQDEKIITLTNNAGGIVGGISNAMPIVFRVAMKPTPSVAKAQTTLNLKTGELQELVIGGRHDSCIVPRAVPCIESAAAIAILDLLM